MQFAYPIAGPRKVQSKDGGVELVLSCKAANIFRQIRSEHLIGQVIGEFVMSCRHWSVGGEDTFLSNFLLIAVKFPQKCQSQEHRVAFVHVKGGDPWFQPF